MTQRQDSAGDMPELVQALSAASQHVTGSGSESEAETLSSIVAAAVETVPGAEQAGVTLLSAEGAITSEAISDETVRTIDELQATFREGPCVTALWDEHTVLIEDMAAETHRWSQFGPAANAAGVGSMLSFQLFARQNSLGALNLYASQPRSFTADSRTLGGLFAMHAAGALGQAQHVAQLHQALASRDLIGQAKGRLMERFEVDAERAFAMLMRSSQETNLKLIAVARWLAEGSTENLAG